MKDNKQTIIYMNCTSSIANKQSTNELPIKPYKSCAILHSTRIYKLALHKIAPVIIDLLPVG